MIFDSIIFSQYYFMMINFVSQINIKQLERKWDALVQLQNPKTNHWKLQSLYKKLRQNHNKFQKQAHKKLIVGETSYVGICKKEDTTHRKLVCLKYNLYVLIEQHHIFIPSFPSFNLLHFIISTSTYIPISQSQQSYNKIMTCQISLGLLEDVSRVTTVQQNFILKIESYNHTFLNSPAVPLSHPNWDFNFAFVGSEKQIIKFYLCTLHPDHFMKVIASGKFDIREYVARYKPPPVSEIRLTLDSEYRNQIILHMKCEFKEGTMSRNEGLKQTRRIQNNKLSSTNRIGNGQAEYMRTMFKGPCENRNFFSFLDKVYKGQSYNFIEPVLK